MAVVTRATIMRFGGVAMLMVRLARALRKDLGRDQQQEYELNSHQVVYALKDPWWSIFMHHHRVTLLEQ